jgi:hypothetical protein
LDPTRSDKYKKKIMIAAIRDPDLFRVGNYFTRDMDIKILGINPLVKRCGINQALWFLVMLIMMRASLFTRDSIRTEMTNTIEKSI